MNMDWSMTSSIDVTHGCLCCRSLSYVSDQSELHRLDRLRTSKPVVAGGR